MRYLSGLTPWHFGEGFGLLLRVARYIWASPCSLIGIVIALLIVVFGGSARRKSGVLEVFISASTTTSPRKGRLAFEAITLGHVIIGRNGQELEQLHLHELEHVRQYERWGTLFFLAYPISSLWQVVRGRRAYWDNYFEVQARAQCAQKKGTT